MKTKYGRLNSDVKASDFYDINDPRGMSTREYDDFMRAKQEHKQDETKHLLSTETNKNRLLEDVQQQKDKKIYSEDEVEDLIYKGCGTVARLQGIALK